MSLPRYLDDMIKDGISLHLYTKMVQLYAETIHHQRDENALTMSRWAQSRSLDSRSGRLRPFNIRTIVRFWYYCRHSSTEKAGPEKNLRFDMCIKGKPKFDWSWEWWHNISSHKDCTHFYHQIIDQYCLLIEPSPQGRFTYNFVQLVVTSCAKANRLPIICSLLNFSEKTPYATAPRTILQRREDDEQGNTDEENACNGDLFQNPGTT